MVSDFLKSGVHRYHKYCLNGLFLKNNLFTRDLSLQFNGLLLVTFFSTYLRWFFGRNCAKTPLVADYHNHVGELGDYVDFVTTLCNPDRSVNHSSVP